MTQVLDATSFCAPAAQPARIASTKAAVGVFAFTLLLSSTLLFLIQPMFARLVLPRLGGSAAVWNTCMVFFQACLLAGYAYAHLLTKHVRTTRRQVMVHAAVLALPLAILPIGLPRDWAPPADANPIPALLMLLAASVGLPFFAIATTAPLVQRWFTSTGHSDAGDPYFLYAASNAGSMAALLGYPLLVEPLMRLGDQTRAWAWGYGAFAVMVLVCGWRAATSSVVQRDAGVPPEGARSVVAWPQRLRWIVLALVPSSHLLGVTTYITTDVAAVPLLWVLPLALYLLTFILAFARKPLLSHRAMTYALPTAVLAPLPFMLAGAALPVWATVGLHLLAFFVAAMVCHGELARTRPDAAHLTEFYLMMSLGGVLGGAFNALAAPLLFTRAVEYPLAIVAACLLCPARQATASSRHVSNTLLPLIVGLLTWGTLALAARLGIGVTIKLALLAAPVMLCLRLTDRRMPFAAAVASLLAVACFFPSTRGELLESHRSFFGIHRLVHDERAGFNELYHGTTMHGRQRADALGQPAQSDAPLTYYHRTGPVGDVMTATRPRRVGVIGLGVGSIAAYANAGDRYAFYEIDPAVHAIAEDDKRFTYLAAARSRGADVNVTLGDARLTLAGAPSHSFDLLVLDAFSGDAIPLHLLTREAMTTYLDKLAPGGVLMVHVSNLYLDLEPVVSNLAADAGCAAVIRADLEMTDGRSRAGAAPSTWMVVARDTGVIERVNGWTRARGVAGSRVWTDDFSNILSTLK